MAIGLSNVNNRKAKRPATSASQLAPAAEPMTLKPEDSKGRDAWSTRGLAREGRSARRERNVQADDLNMIWLDWTTIVTGSEKPNRVLRTVRQLLELERFVFEFLVYDLQIPMRAKKRILEIRSSGARALQIRKLLVHH